MEKRRRIRRKSSFGKRIMVTVLSLAMLIGLFVPGFAVGAKEIIPDGGVVDPAPEELFQSDAAKNLQQRVTLFVLTDPQSDPTAVEEYNALVQEVGTADYLSDAERLELQMKLSSYAAVTVPESDGGTTSDGSLEIAQPYISVKKTFVGLTSSEIPSDFAITVSKDGGSVYTLTMAPDNQYYKGFDNTTMTASWEINGLSNGTYMASESGFTIDKYDCLATGTPAGILDGAGVTISESSYGTATELDVINNKDKNTFTVDGQQFFAGALKNGNVIVIMDHDPSIAEKNQVVHTLKTMDLSNDWKINSATFYYYVMPAVGTGEKILVTDPEEIEIGSDNVTILNQSAWTKVAYGTLQFNERINGDIHLTNTYTPKKGNLTIKKEFAGFDEADIDRPDVTVNVHNLDGSLMEAITLNNSNNWTKTYEGLPVGFYKVQETAPVKDSVFQGANKYSYKLTGVDYSDTEADKDSMSAEVRSNQTTIATITNTYEKQAGTLTVTKSFTNIGENSLSDSDSIQIKVVGNSLNESATLNSANSWTWSRSDLPVGDYTVTETSYPQTVENNKYKYVNTTVQVNGGDVTEALTATAPVEHGKDATVAITNNYKLNQTDITLKKIVSSTYAADKDREFEFNVTIDDTPYSGNPIKLKHDGSAVIKAVTIGSKIKITEVLGDDAPYFTVGFNRNEGITTASGNFIEFTAAYGDSVVVTNTRNTSEISLTKMVEGNMISYDEAFSFTYADNGSASLKHGDSIRFTVPMGVPVTITENLDKYNTTVTIDGESYVTEGKTVTFTPTKAEHEVIYTNAHSITIATGIISDSMPYILLISAVLLGGLVLIISKRRQMF